MISTKRRIAFLFFGFGLVISLVSCKESPDTRQAFSFQLPPKPQPKSYICYRAIDQIVPDGILNEQSWALVPWTDYFADIEGSTKPAPKYKTRAKLLWDDVNLYISAELEEPHVWATLKQRDTVIFYDNDFEVFIDPDGDTHAYYELEVNAFGTAWDLLLLKPYRDGGPPVNGWDISGLIVGIHIDGTINNPKDSDKGWTVEMVIPLSSLKECAKGANPPTAGDHWRLGFSRVEWRIRVENGVYKKEINPQTGKPYPEDNWVWSPQGLINMHMPEMWGYLQFSHIQAGSGAEEFIADADFDIKWALRMVYYAEFDYYARYNTYSSRLSDIGLSPDDFPVNLAVPAIKSGRTTFESYMTATDPKYFWSICQDGRISYHRDSLAVK